MKRFIDNYNIMISMMSKNIIFVFTKSLLTSPLFITIYYILGIIFSIFLVYKIALIWIYLNTKLIEGGYLPKIIVNNMNDMNDLFLICFLTQLLIISISFLVIPCMYFIIMETVYKINDDLDKFDVESQNDLKKRLN